MEEEKYPYTIKLSRGLEAYIEHVSEKTGLKKIEVVLEIFSWYRYSFKKQEQGYMAKFTKETKRKNFLGFLISVEEAVVPELLGKVSTLDQLLGEIEIPDENS